MFEHVRGSGCIISRVTFGADNLTKDQASFEQENTQLLRFLHNFWLSIFRAPYLERILQQEIPKRFHIL